MNAGSQWRLALARHIAPFYAQNSHVAAMMVSGSTARGHADRYSDIELAVFWHRPPTDEERRVVIEQAGGDLHLLFPYDPAEEVWSDDFMMGRAAPDQPKSGVLVEAGHYMADFMPRLLEGVLTRYDPDEGKQNVIAGLLDGIALYQEDVIAQWQSRASVYPDALALAVVNRHAQIDHFWRWEMFLHRHENLMLLYQSFNQIQQHMLHVLLAVNHVYYFGFKWLDVLMERLPIAPRDLADRLRLPYQVEPAQGAHVVAALVEDTYDLIERHLPGVDVEQLRHIFRFRRPTWDQPPAYGASG
jgi:hypothetical protein